MPARHISHQSFDEILSELGEDPAIPDPHGIRKPSSPKPPPAKAPQKQEYLDKNAPHFEIPSLIKGLVQWKKLALVITLALTLICIAPTLFFINQDATKATENASLQATKEHFTQTKKELALLREEMLQIEDDIYDELDKLEVSIYSLNENKAQISKKPKVKAIPFESELRQWRYLGISQMGALERVFFHNGKGTIMIEKGANLLGDWKLSNIEKDAVVITHPQGKSVVIKAPKSE
jgi:hypothetical protein